MRDINTIILTDASLFFVPAALTDSVVSFSYDEEEHIEAFLSELETVYARQEFNILFYSKSDELIVSDAPALMPWEVTSFTATHREERYGSQDRVFAHTEYTRCNGKPIIRDWVLTLNDQAYSVYESLLERDILILAVYSFPSSLFFALSHAGHRLRDALKSVARLPRAQSKKNIMVVYDCQFIYFFIVDQCGVVFFRHTPIEDAKKDGLGALIIREVDLTLRFVMAKGVLSDSDQVTFNLMVPDQLLKDTQLCSQSSYVGLSMLSNLEGFHCRSLKSLLNGIRSDQCDSISIPLLNAVVNQYSGFPRLKTQAGKIKDSFVLFGTFVWVCLFVVGIYSSYYIGSSVSKLISLQEGVSVLQYQKSKLGHLRNVIQSKLSLPYDPTDMYQLVLFNDAFINVQPNNRWTGVYLPLLTVIEQFAPQVKIREFTFEDEQANLLGQPMYKATALLALPVDAYSLSQVDSLMNSITNRLQRSKGVKEVQMLKQPFDDDVKKLLKIIVEDYEKDYYFYIVSYKFTPPVK
jgi:hypothetical protein